MIVNPNQVGTSVSTSSGSWSRLVPWGIGIGVWTLISFAVFGVEVFAPIIAAWLGGISILWGAVGGVVVGVKTLFSVFSWTFLEPLATACILGMLAGMVAAWLQTGLAVRGKTYKTLATSLFSKDLLEGNFPAYVGKLLASLVVAYVTTAGVMSTGFLDAGATDLVSMFRVIQGGGAIGSGGPSTNFMAFITLLVALLVVGALIGLVAGAGLGAMIGAIVAPIGVTSIMQGATKGFMFRLLTPYRPEDTSLGRGAYVAAGAAFGAVQSMAVGALVGAAIFVGRLASLV